VPDLVGLRLEDAQDTLSKAGLRVRIRHEPVNDENLDNLVIGQLPPAGDMVSPGQLVELTVGDAPGTVG
jgi:beta-lactam-binding protein with PASTA domain